MPRGQLALPESDGEAIRLFAEHHIIQVRRSEKTGRILEVDHVEFGWMKPERFYRLQKLHDLLPMLEKAVEGGYRMKAQLWQSSIEVSVLGSGTSFPIGMAIFAGALSLHFIDKARGAMLDSILDIAALFLPFGELWYLYRGAIAIPELEAAVTAILGGIGETVEDAQEAFQDIISGRPPYVPGGPVPPL